MARNDKFSKGLELNYRQKKSLHNISSTKNNLLIWIYDFTSHGHIINCGPFFKRPAFYAYRGIYLRAPQPG